MFSHSLTNLQDLKLPLIKTVMELNDLLNVVYVLGSLNYIIVFNNQEIKYSYITSDKIWRSKNPSVNKHCIYSGHKPSSVRYTPTNFR